MSKIFTAIKPVHHDGKLHRPGRTLSLTDEQAMPLLALGVITIFVEDEWLPAASTLALNASTLAKLTNAELVTYAAAHNIAVPPDATKDQILTLITDAKAVAA